MLDVDWGDLIYYLGDDPHTESIVIYMEIHRRCALVHLGRARGRATPSPSSSSSRAARRARPRRRLRTPARSPAATKCSKSAFRRSGVLRVNTIAELFYMAEVLAKQPRPKGPRLTILTNAGGPGVLATDALITTAANWPRFRLERWKPSMRCCRRPGATTIRWTSWETPARRAMPGRSKSPLKIRTAMVCWSSSRRRR